MPSSDTHSQRRRRRPELNIDTSPTHKSSSFARDPVPLTPPSQSKPPPALHKSSKATTTTTTTTSRALRVPPSHTRHADDTFLETPTPVDPDMSNKENDNPVYPRPRDSHDLSLPARQVTRDSLMANMLLSLDQFSMVQGGVAGPGGETAPAAGAAAAPSRSGNGAAPAGYYGPGHGRGNLFDEPSRNFSYDSDGDALARAITNRDRRAANEHNYSYSSDFEVADDSSRYSSQLSRGRRSNSSSNFQTSLGRINSMRESMRSAPGTPRHLHSRGGKGSKSSSTNSIDAGYAQVLSSQRLVHGFGGRSSSFDLGRRSLGTQVTQGHASQWRVDFPNTFLNDEYDAAPTPTVPGGPRRLPPPLPMPSTSTSIPPPPPEPIEPRSPGIERKRSTRSSKTASSGRKNSMMREPAAKAPAAFELDSAPAPHIGYGKTKASAPSASNPSQTLLPQTKEKPGFFRRVFGSSKNAANTTSDPRKPPTSAAVSSTSVDTDDRSGSRSHLAAQTKAQSTPPSRDTSSSHSHHNTLQKKPSSFFRRRKKSVVDETRPTIPTPSDEPPLPTRLPTYQLPPAAERLNSKLEPSPVSSLRKVMNPYLKASPASPNTPDPFRAQPHGSDPSSEGSPRVTGDAAAQEQQQQQQQQQGGEQHHFKRSFSPEYEPSPNARIREVKPGSSDGDSVFEHEHDSEVDRRTDTPTRPPPQIPRPPEKRSNSFLNLDGSDDNDGDTYSGDKDLKPRRRAPGAALLSSTDASPSAERTQSTSSSKPRNRKGSQPSAGDDEDKRTTLVLPLEGARSGSIPSESTGTDYKSAVGTPNVHVEDISNPTGSYDPGDAKPIDEPDFVVGDPTDDDRKKAKSIFDGNEDFIQKEKAASWMGEEGLVRQRALRAYMELYDFANNSIVQGLRRVCERLVFKAETQQVDRILVAFSRRWCECNPNHGFKASDVIHTICYSIMLLNTDLYLADIEHKMTRSQFIKNTMTTITQAVIEAVPDAFRRPSILPEKSGLLGVSDDTRPSSDDRSNRFSFKPAPKRDPGTDGAVKDATDGCGPLVRTPFEGTMRAWEAQVEIVLKDTYMSIREERLPLFGAEPPRSLAASQSQSSLSVMGMLKRSPSVLSKAPSEGQMSLRGRVADSARASTARFASKSRSRPRLGHNGFSSSRTSFDDGNSIWSPATSSATWSRYSLGRTQTSMSMDSFGTSFPRGDYQQSIGFANALSQAIIRDDASGFGPVPSIMSDEASAPPLLEDESLELAGPPWVKEGMVTHKHHLDGVDKKAKDRHWSEVFAVIQKGQMSLFSFSANKSLGRKSRAARNAAKSGNTVLVGGGNWQDNATNLGTFSLRQTLASALPSPGYSRARPHVWALSLPTGAVHLFQVGTAEIIKEFVTTANYWSARLSTHPLVGGISNVEYGWSEAIINNALVTAIHESSGSAPHNGRSSRPGSSTTNGNASQGRTSIQSAGRSVRSASLDFPGGPGNTGPILRGTKLPGDRIHISEWSPPTQSMRPSNLPESEQLSSLVSYVKGIEDELQAHNRLRSPMLLAFTPRGHNAGKSMANWERKSAYLLREIVKFRTYVDCLQQAETRKEEIYSERDLARRAACGDLSDEEGVDAEQGDTTLKAN